MSVVNKLILPAILIVSLFFACIPATPLSENEPVNTLALKNESASPNLSPSIGPTSNEKVVAIVTNVIDGDTIEVSIQGSLYKLRYIGIDSPELNSVGINMKNIALNAANKDRELVSGKIVELEKDVSEMDRYGRLLRYVYVSGIFVNAELARLGYATCFPYPPDLKYQDLLTAMQAEAKTAKRGIWGTGGYSQEIKSTEKGLYIGSTKSDKYHYPSCFWAKQISTSNEVWFASKEDAQSRGYVPCKVCKPPQ